jgi:hypothetical protein
MPAKKCTQFIPIMNSKRCGKPFRRFQDSLHAIVQELDDRDSQPASVPYTPIWPGNLGKPAVPLPSHQIEARVAKDTNQHIFSAQMSLAEIIEELPKLTPEERRTIYQQIERLDGEPNFEPTPEMLGAIEEGTRSAQTERMYTAEEIKDRVHRWANSSFD